MCEKLEKRDMSLFVPEDQNMQEINSYITFQEVESGENIDILYSNTKEKNEGKNRGVMPLVLGEGDKDVLNLPCMEIVKEYTENSNAEKSETMANTELKRKRKASPCKQPKQLLDLKDKDKILPFALKCIKCSKGFHKVSILKEHQSSCTVKKKPKLKIIESVSDESDTDERSETDIAIEPFLDDMKFENHREKSRYLKTLYEKVESGYKCRYCPKVFEKPFRVLCHERVHTGIRPFSCDLCGMSFAQKGARNNHRRKVLCRTPVQRARPQTKDNANLLQHEEDMKTPEELFEKIPDIDGGGYKCNYCHMTGNKPYNILIHERTHTGERPYVCDYCPVQFTSLGSLNFHIREGKCKGAEGKSKKKKVNQNVRKQYTKIPGKGFRCSYCDALFPRAYAVMVHEKSHAEANREKKCACGLMFTTESQYDSHVAQGCTGSESSAVSHTCKRCNETFSQLSALNEHSSKCYSTCDYCKQQFSNEVDLKAHIQTHDNLKLYECSTCFKKFARESEYILHSEAQQCSHLYLFTCDECGDHFVDKEMYNEHELKQHPAKYSCDECPQSFTTIPRLRLHKLEHEQYSPYRCEKCEKKFENKLRYGMHMVRFHGLEELDIKFQYEENLQVPIKHTCSDCPLMFTTKYRLSAHKMQHKLQQQHKEKLCYKCQIVFPNFLKYYKHKTNTKSACNSKKNLQIRSKCTFRQYSCKLCHQKFRRKDRLDKHLQQHGETKKEIPETKSETVDSPSLNSSFVLRCRQCSKTFEDKIQFSDHVSQMHGTQVFKCKLCPKAFFSREGLERHAISHSRSYKCEWSKECNKSFRTKKQLEVHTRFHTGEKVFKCEFPGCLEEFPMNGGLMKHMIAHTGVKPYKCKFCDKSFMELGSQKKHQNTVHGEMDVSGEMKVKVYICHTCGKSFKSPLSLQSHVKVIHEGVTYECNLCGKTLGSERGLSNHRLLHDENNRKFACPFDECSMRFITKGSLQQHIASHSEERPYKCIHCPKAYKKSSGLQEHVQSSHSVDRPYVCDICDKAFYGPRPLRSHYRIHTGEKPYACNYCGKGFVQLCQVKRHEKTHTGEKPYQCEYCDKRFADNSGKKDHETTHTGIKPAVCDRCDAGFVRKHDLRVHILKRHADDLDAEEWMELNSRKPISVKPKLHKCLTCGQTFLKKHSLKLHIMKKHPEMMISNEVQPGMSLLSEDLVKSLRGMGSQMIIQTPSNDQATVSIPIELATKQEEESSPLQYTAAEASNITYMDTDQNIVLQYTDDGQVIQYVDNTIIGEEEDDDEQVIRYVDEKGDDIDLTKVGIQEQLREQLVHYVDEKGQIYKVQNDGNAFDEATNTMIQFVDENGRPVQL